MPSDTPHTSEEVRPPGRPRISMAFWFLLGMMVLVGVGVLLPVGHRPIIDKVRIIDVETAQIRAALDSYSATFGAFPVGDSSAIFRALRGENPRKIIFFQCREASVAPDGGMLDPWGTPYRVYFSGKEPLIRSAGPNKQFDESSRKPFDDYIR